MTRIAGNEDCQKCPFHTFAEHVCLMGKGKIPSEIMIVMDQPGWKEDASGKPLTGNMLTFVKGLLDSVGIDLHDCFITNAVKCRGPEKSKPKVKEINACRTYLEDEIQAVKPRFILLMGSASLKSQLNQSKITEVHGQAQVKEGITYFPTFSPGIAFRDPQKGTLLEGDLKRFADLVRGKKPNKVKLDYHPISSIEDLEVALEDLQSAKAVSVDIETTGLNRFKDEVTLVGFGTSHNTQWILPCNIKWSPFKKKEIQRKILEMIAEVVNGKYKRKKRRIITHNGKFDNLFLRHHYEVRFNYTFDTMIAAFLLNENTPNGLKYLARTLLGAPNWDIGLDDKKGQGLTKEKIIKYLGFDVHYTMDLYKFLKVELAKDPVLVKIFKYLMMPVFATYEDIQMEGVWIYKERFEAVRTKLKANLEASQKRLIEICREEGIKNPENINFGSTQQLGKLLFEELGLPIVEITKTGNPSTGEPVMLQLRDKHPIIEEIMKFKGYRQQISFFIDGWKKRMIGNKLYPNFNIHVVVTGRTSSNNPNLQQVPRDKVIRSLIGAPPGWVMVEADYSQVELRVVAELSGDPTMKEIYQLGQDIHRRTASVSSGKPEDQITKDERKSAKAINFGFVYGMGARKFKDYAFEKYGVKMSEKQAFEFRKRFFELYSTLPDWHEKQRRIVRAFGQVRNPIGRIRRLPEINSPDKGKRAEAERQGINSPVQSFASDVLLMSLIEINKTLPKDKVRIIGSVHDAGLYIVRKDCINEIVPQIKNIMEHPKILKRLGVNLSIPIVADVEVGDWGNGVEWSGETITFEDDQMLFDGKSVT